MGDVRQPSAGLLQLVDHRVSVDLPTVPGEVTRSRACSQVEDPMPPAGADGVAGNVQQAGELIQPIALLEALEQPYKARSHAVGGEPEMYRPQVAA